MLPFSFRVVLVLFSTFFISCATPSPRFRTTPDQKSQTKQSIDDDAAQAARIRAEETREDDKKVDLSEIDMGSDSSEDFSSMPRDRVLLEVVDYLGTPYVYGGSTKQGVDCSGFTSSIFSSALHQKLPRSTKDQYVVGSEVDRSELRFGDLVFFNTTGRTPSHVGIYIEDNLFAHASVTYGVTFSSLESTYYKKRYVGARRVVE